MPLMLEGGYVKSSVVVNVITEAVRDIDNMGAPQEVGDYVALLKFKILKHAEDIKPNDITRNDSGASGADAAAAVHEGEPSAEPQPPYKSREREEFEKRKAKIKRNNLG